MKDIEFVKSILPDHYTVEPSKKPGSIHCFSKEGMHKPDSDADDDEAFDKFFDTVKAHFGSRFQEVYHNTCFCHVDFTIYLKQPVLH